MTVFFAFLFIPVVVTSVTPLVDLRGHVRRTRRSTHPSWPSPDAPERGGGRPEGPPVGRRHRPVDPAGGPGHRAKIPPSVLATAQTDATQLANTQKFAPELAVIQANPALFAKLATYKNPATIPPSLTAQAIAAAGGGAKGLKVLATIAANQAPSPG